MSAVRHIRLRRDTAANWSLANPILQSGETGLEIDTRLMKVGDGGTAWNNLAYFNITPRIVTIANGSSISINVARGDIFYQENVLTAGTLTINNPTGTSFDGQKIMIRVKSDAVQNLVFGPAYVGSIDMPLPVSTTGDGKTDLIGFMFNSAAGKWHLLALNFGF